MLLPRSVVPLPIAAPASRPRARIARCALLALALAGCGAKGDLVLPEDAPPPAAEPAPSPTPPADSP